MKDLHKHVLSVVTVIGLTLGASSGVWSQALARPEKAKPVAGDAGMSSMVVTDQPGFRVLRNYAEPGATRRLHSHDDTSYHVLVLVTGELSLTIEGEPPVRVTPGEALHLKGGVKHTFTNTGKVTATMVEVFGKKQP